MTAAPPADDNTLVEQAIARVLDAEHSARISIAEAQVEAAAIAERARADARAIGDRALQRIVAIRARFEQRIASEVAAFDDAAARLDTQYALDERDRQALDRAIVALAAELTGDRP